MEKPVDGQPISAVSRLSAALNSIAADLQTPLIIGEVCMMTSNQHGYQTISGSYVIKENQMERREFIELLKKLLLTHSPSGDEGEMERVVKEEMENCCDDVWVDECDNVVGLIRGQTNENPVRVMAHKDEIGMIVKRVESDGRLRVESTGGANTWRYGEGPMDILSDSGVLTGVLSIGPSHTSPEAGDMQQARSKPLDWDMVRIDAKLSKEELTRKGVRVGARVVVSRLRKEPLILGDYICAWALDDKGGVAIMLNVAKQLSPGCEKLPRDVYFIATSAEEPGISGGAYAARTLPGNETIAIEVAPVHREYDIQNCASPVVIYKDSAMVYSKNLSDKLYHLGKTLGFGCQACSVSSFGSDASHALKYGLTGKAACVGFPTENTHGYEIAQIDGMENSAKLILTFLLLPLISFD
jgi:putative aminopeptidase FrvX